MASHWRWQLFAIRCIFKTRESSREMHAPLPRGGRRHALGNLVLQDLLSLTSRYNLVTRLLELGKQIQARLVTVSSDSSRNWRSLWSVVENLVWSLQGSLWC
jgi:hypothetical protein